MTPAKQPASKRRAKRQGSAGARSAGSRTALRKAHRGIDKPGVPPEAPSNTHLDWSAGAHDAADTLVCVGSSPLVQRNRRGSNGRGPHPSPSLGPIPSQALRNSLGLHEAGCRPWSAPFRTLRLSPQDAHSLWNSSGSHEAGYRPSSAAFRALWVGPTSSQVLGNSLRLHEAGCRPRSAPFRALSTRPLDPSARQLMHPFRLCEPRLRPEATDSRFPRLGCKSWAGMHAAGIWTGRGLLHVPAWFQPLRPTGRSGLTFPRLLTRHANALHLSQRAASMLQVCL